MKMALTFNKETGNTFVTNAKKNCSKIIGEAIAHPAPILWSYKGVHSK